MTEDNAAQPVPEPDDITKVTARLVTPLNGEFGWEKGNSDQRLLVISLGEPDGQIDLVALLPEDVARLGEMLSNVEMPEAAASGHRERRRKEAFAASLLRSQHRVRAEGKDVFLKKLKVGIPALGGYLDHQLRVLAEQIRRHCPSRPAARALEKQLTTTVLVAVDFTRWAK